MTIGGKTFKAGDIITLNGTKGMVYEGAMKMMDATENPLFKKFMALANNYRTMGVRTNADTPEDAKIARDFGAGRHRTLPHRAHVLRRGRRRAAVHLA